MIFDVKSGNIPIGDEGMDYISFGSGAETLVLIPGLGDGLSTVKGKGTALALAYRPYTKKYTVYVFSRRNRLPEGFSTRDMAADQAEAMKLLGISRADVMGVSQGGMIAQYLAIDYPDMVNKLVLAVTLARQNETIREAVGAWIDMAEKGDYKSLMIDTAERTYSEKYLRKLRLMYPILTRAGKPKSFDRFLIQARSCAGHDAYNELGKISCPTFVIGGDSDKTVGPESSAELAKAISGSRLYVYKGLGHSAYEEAKDFNDRVLEFLKE